MKMSRRLILLFATFVLAACSESGPSIDIRAEPAANGELQFQLTNNTEHELDFYLSSLPWSDDIPHRLKFSAHEISTETADHKVIGPSAILAHGITEKTTIAAGATITGQVDPMNRIDTRDIDDSNEVFLFWTYRLRVCDLDQMFVHAGVAQETEGSWVVAGQSTTVFDRICPLNQGKNPD